MITQEYLKEILDYSPDTGIFVWKVDKAFRARKGDKAGSLTDHGYIKLTINRKRYYAHRLAWIYVYGSHATQQLDHINGVRDDNRVENLREVSNRENGSNRKEHREGKPVGISFYAQWNYWSAAIQIKGRTTYLGSYPTKELAAEAYQKALAEYKRELNE